jgi:hypothetical protein
MGGDTGQVGLKTNVAGCRVHTPQPATRVCVPDRPAGNNGRTDRRQSNPRLHHLPGEIKTGFVWLVGTAARHVESYQGWATRDV